VDVHVAVQWMLGELGDVGLLAPDGDGERA
jgi:hypothetical protein